MAALGGPETGVPADVAYLWPDNERTWQHWQAVRTQWRIGMGGETGLDYAGVRAYLKSVERCPKRRDRLFAHLRACEHGHLEGVAERERRKAKTS